VRVSAMLPNVDVCSVVTCRLVKEKLTRPRTFPSKISTLLLIMNRHKIYLSLPPTTEIRNCVEQSLEINICFNSSPLCAEHNKETILRVDSTRL
jgi:hypothetical protein